METLSPFKFKRTKGLIWVCDLAKSSNYLNQDETVDYIEAFLPRFYYVFKLLVESFGGTFFKWTGDGFFSFFELDLDREKTHKASKIFTAAWHLTFMSNVTQFGLEPSKKFSIRHGITYEQDALLMNPQSNNSIESWDVIGRSIVLAFRLAGVEAEFPSIVTVRELVSDPSKFTNWKPKKEEVLKYFKGEKFGTSNLYKSTFDPGVAKIKIHKENVQEVISKVESGQFNPSEPINVFALKMMEGPDWCQKIMYEEIIFIKEKVVENLKQMISLYSKIEENVNYDELNATFESIKSEISTALSKALLQ